MNEWSVHQKVIVFCFSPAPITLGVNERVWTLSGRPPAVYAGFPFIPQASTSNTTNGSIPVYNKYTPLQIEASSFPPLQQVCTMATKTLEARFEHLTVNDENETPPSTMLKSKVLQMRCVNLQYTD